jgi:hypothetical protein
VCAWLRVCVCAWWRLRVCVCVIEDVGLRRNRQAETAKHTCTLKHTHTHTSRHTRTVQAWNGRPETLN